MINTNLSCRAPRASSQTPPSPQEQREATPPANEDRFDLTGVPTAVKLYDMSPIWGPQPGPLRIPMGVRGLA